MNAQTPGRGAKIGFERKSFASIETHRAQVPQNQRRTFLAQARPREFFRKNRKSCHPSKLPTVLLIAAVIAGITSARSTANYDDLAARGYCWVTVDGPYACPSKDDLRLIVRNHTTETELQMIRNQRAYYLLQGDIVKVVREDPASGMSLIRVAGIPRDLWTLTKFLSKRPVKNAFGMVETPETAGLILTGTTWIADSVEPPRVTPAPSASSTSNQTATPVASPPPRAGPVRRFSQ
jgi:hypothetical protein